MYLTREKILILAENVAQMLPVAYVALENKVIIYGH